MNQQMDFTRKFNLNEDKGDEIKAILTSVYNSLQEKGITPSIRSSDISSPKTPPISPTTTTPAPSSAGWTGMSCCKSW